MRALTARLRRLEQSRHAAVTARPSVEELRAEARGEPVRPAVREMAGKMRDYGLELEAATLGFCRWPNANKL